VVLDEAADIRQGRKVIDYNDCFRLEYYENYYRKNPHMKNSIWVEKDNMEFNFDT